MTETADATAHIETEKARLQAENPAAWEQIVASARELVPASIAKRPSGRLYQGALDGFVNQIVSERFEVGKANTNAQNV